MASATSLNLSNYSGPGPFEKPGIKYTFKDAEIIDETGRINVTARTAQIASQLKTTYNLSYDGAYFVRPGTTKPIFFYDIKLIAVTQADNVVKLSEVNTKEHVTDYFIDLTSRKLSSTFSYFYILRKKPANVTEEAARTSLEAWKKQFPGSTLHWCVYNRHGTVVHFDLKSPEGKSSSEFFWFPPNSTNGNLLYCNNTKANGTDGTVYYNYHIQILVNCYDVIINGDNANLLTVDTEEDL